MDSESSDPAIPGVDRLGQDPERTSAERAEHPDRIGVYRIARVLGEGGMGVVYEAEQTQPVKRRVALKLIRAGLRSDDVATRFEAERQALAVMEHPNIAKVLDAGTTADGSPFFVMEYVDGIPITTYCDEHQVTTRARLELFIPICRAIQHAHQKGVIHRDLKPSNVLITEQAGMPAPKVIDFGIAKAMGVRLTEQTLATSYGVVIGTPAYMSPEQAEGTGLDVDTRSDIYGLGVMLYELLVGRLPINPEELGVMAFIAQLMARETNPPTPSDRLIKLNGDGARIAALRKTDLAALRRELKGDLDWIVMKAIAPERERRYETANGLAMDLERHLHDEPVVARPPSAGYRLQKFVKRNKVGVAAAVAAVLALVAGAVTTSVGFVRATSAEGEARREAETAQQVSDFLVSLFEVSDPSQARGRTVTARELLDRGAERVAGEELSDQPVVQARFLTTIGSVYQKLGLWDAARPLHEQALRLRRATLGDQHPEVAASLYSLGVVAHRQGLYAEAESLLQRSVLAFEQVPTPDPLSLAESINWLANNYFMNRQPEKAEPLWQRVLTIRQSVLGPNDPGIGNIANNLAIYYRDHGNYVRAESLYKRSLGIREHTYGEDSPEVALARRNIAEFYRIIERYAEAESLQLRALSVQERVLGPEHPEVGTSLNTLGGIYAGVGRLNEADSVLRRGLSIHQQAYGSTHRRTAWTILQLACVAYYDGRYGDADSLARESEDTYEKAFGAGARPAYDSLNQWARREC